MIYTLPVSLIGFHYQLHLKLYHAQQPRDLMSDDPSAKSATQLRQWATSAT